jgi:hypothetical protein
MIMLFVLSCWWIFYWVCQHQSQWILLAWHQKTGWKIVDYHLESFAFNVVNSTFCSRFLVIVNGVIETSAKKVSVIICRDSLSKDDFKKLRLYLLNGVD